MVRLMDALQFTSPVHGSQTASAMGRSTQRWLHQGRTWSARANTSEECKADQEVTTQIFEFKSWKGAQARRATMACCESGAVTASLLVQSSKGRQVSDSRLLC